MNDLEHPTYYDLLEVESNVSSNELRAAYRRLARLYHPDLTSEADAVKMRQINLAWNVLSDPTQRQNYDEILLQETLLEEIPVPQPAPTTGRSRRKAWSAGVQAQIDRLAKQSGRSATQTLLLNSPLGSRNDYNKVVTKLAYAISNDVESRVRSARAAGAMPLDLGVAATLVGIRTVADELRREASNGLTTEIRMKANLLDRMWDVLAHELPLALVQALGGNPQTTKHLL